MREAFVWDQNYGLMETLFKIYIITCVFQNTVCACIMKFLIA